MLRVFIIQVELIHIRASIALCAITTHLLNDIMYKMYIFDVIMLYLKCYEEENIYLNFEKKSVCYHFVSGLNT